MGRSGGWGIIWICCRQTVDLQSLLQFIDRLEVTILKSGGLFYFKYCLVFKNLSILLIQLNQTHYQNEKTISNSFFYRKRS